MRIFIILNLVLMTVACSGLSKKDLGMANMSPDETVVEQRKPLSLPPEFDVRPVVKVDADE